MNKLPEIIALTVYLTWCVASFASTVGDPPPVKPREIVTWLDVATLFAALAIPAFLGFQIGWGNRD